MSTNQSVQPRPAHAPISLEADDVYMGGVSKDGNLWFTRHNVGSGAWSPFFDVKASTAGDIGTILDVDLMYSGNMCAVNDSGGLWLTYTGDWPRFSDVKAKAGDPGHFLKVAVGQTGARPMDVIELHILGITREGVLWHAVTGEDGSWTPFFDVASQAGDPGAIVQVACTSTAKKELFVCVVTEDGRLWLTTRQGTGSWTPFIDVKRRAGNRGYFIDVDCTVHYGIGFKLLHVCGLTDDGKLWHAIRRADTSWIPFDDVKAKASDPGAFISVATGVGKELHVTGATSDGRLWLATRQIDGTWTPFDDVEAGAGERGSFSAAGVDSFPG